MKLRAATRMPRVPKIGACFALAANLFASGMPVLHVWVHEVAHAHHTATIETHAVESNDEIHPSVLHDDCLRVPCVAFELSPAATEKRFELASFITSDGKLQQTFPSVSSRAPPGLDQARAPPVA